MKFELFGAAMTVALLLTIGTAVSEQETDRTDNWREEFACTLGVQAFVFGLPYVHLPTLRWDWATHPISSEIQILTA